MRQDKEAAVPDDSMTDQEAADKLDLTLSQLEELAANHGIPLAGGRVSGEAFDQLSMELRRDRAKFQLLDASGGAYPPGGKPSYVR